MEPSSAEPGTTAPGPAAGRPVLHHRADGDPAAPPLLLGPSIGTTTALWDALVPALAQDHRVVRWDLPGHGGSPASLLPDPGPGATTVADLGRLVLDLADRLGIDRFGCAGDSLGGAVGTWLAAHHGERIAALAVVCSSARFGDPENWRKRAADVREGGARAIGELADTARARWFPAERDEGAQRSAAAFSRSAAADRLITAHRTVDPTGYAACCDALAELDLRSDLAWITAPTLVVAGRGDPATPPAHARALVDGIPNATLLELPGVGHLAPAEAPDRLLAALVPHFAGGAPSTGADAARRAAGMTVRRAVLGDAHVDRAVAATTGFTAPFQDLITRYAWGEVWSRPGLDRRTRSCITLTALVAHGHLNELAMHVRGALRNGLTPDEIGEVLLQTAIYCGVPAANAAFAVASRVLAEIAEAPETARTDPARTVRSEPAKKEGL
ncbi:MAG TPA: 4-carboxymuconolactone decarboxylase [Actinocrinis sp.]